MTMCTRCQQREVKVVVSAVDRLCYACWALSPVSVEEDAAFQQMEERTS